MRTDLKRDSARFLIAGALNTLLTSLVYFVFLNFLNPSASYAVAWAFGIVFVVTVYPDKVFPMGRKAVRDRVALGLLNVGVFAGGLAVLWFATRLIGDSRIAFVIALLLTTMLNFIIARALLRRTD